MYALTKNVLPCTLALAAYLCGCAETSATYTQLNSPPRGLQPRRPDQIQVFSSGQPDRPHVDVGLISVQQGPADETPASLIDVLRRVAAERGCDALVLAPPSTTTKPTGIVLVQGTYSVFSGTCVVYR
jgi:hypothetical protein